MQNAEVNTEAYFIASEGCGRSRYIDGRAKR